MMEQYKNYVEQLQRIADVNNSSAVLQWDQEVYMPEKGADSRARQLMTLSGIAHDLSVSPELGDLLEYLSQHSGDLSNSEQKNIHYSLIDYKERIRYTRSFVEKLSRKISESFQAWQEAKTKKDFSIFSPHLKELIDLKKEECEIIGYSGHPYNALLDQYEKGLTVEKLDVLFTDVKTKLKSLIDRIRLQPAPDDSFMHKHYDKDAQWKFGLHVLEKMGYDFKAGRQDISSHPFTTSFSSLDVRVTTRINENDLAEMMWSCIHEGGHALYEQGLDSDAYGLPSGQYLSLGVHESQSRLWENNVGRSLEYWNFFFPLLKNTFPEQLDQVTVDDFFRAMNKVEPSFIRTNADELTYHFHVMIRYELEKSLIEGTLQVESLEDAWNKKYKEYLGIDVTDVSKGVLQDVHWSHGSFGYFPTYSLGSFLAAQLFAQAKKELNAIETDISHGETTKLLEWLRIKVHKVGRTMSPEELCVRITGEPLDFKYFMQYANEKYKKVYPGL